MESKKLFIWIVCVVCFFNSCKKEQTPEKSEFSIVGYFNIPSALTIKAYIVLSEDDLNGVEIASSGFDNGNFKLILQEPLDDKLLSNFRATFEEEFEISCPDAKGARIGYMEVYRSPHGTLPYIIGQAFCGKYFEIRDTPTEYYSHKVNKDWLYADKDVTIKGTYNNQGRIVGSVDWSFKKGWNEIYVEEILEINWEAGGTYTWTTIETTTKSERYVGLEWYLWDETF